MLSSIHNKEFYLEIAESHELLEQVLEDEFSLEEKMDYYNRVMAITDCTKELVTYLSVLKELGSSLDTEDLEKRCKALIWGELQNLGYVAGIGAAALGGILLAIPPFTLAEPLLAGAGVGLAAKLHKNQDYINDTKKRKNIIFDPVSATAAYYDSDIGRAFILDDLIYRRDRFARTYRDLSYGERARINGELEDYLEAGILEMSSLELEEYLDISMEPEYEE